MYQASEFDRVSPQSVDPAARTGKERPPSATARKPVTFGESAEARDSLSANFNREIEAWARHALGANGFGDCP